jgi:energy-converting hydrogenase Eha subunit C
MTLLISGIIGAVMMIAFLSFMAIWVKAPPLVTIILLVIGLMLYDLYKDVRAAGRNNGA